MAILFRKPILMLVIVEIFSITCFSAASTSHRVRFPSDNDEEHNDADLLEDASTDHAESTASITSYTPTNGPMTTSAQNQYGSKYLLSGFSLFDMYPMLQFTLARPPFLPQSYPTIYPTLFPPFFSHNPAHFEPMPSHFEPMPSHFEPMPSHFEPMPSYLPLEDPTFYHSISVDSLLVPLIGLIGLDLMQPEILMTRRLQPINNVMHQNGPRTTAMADSASTTNLNIQPSVSPSAVHFPGEGRTSAGQHT